MGNGLIRQAGPANCRHLMPCAVFFVLSLVLALAVSAQEQPPAKPAGDPAQAAQQTNPGLFAADSGVRLLVDEKKVELDGFICITKGLLELVACTRGGKDHESLVVLKCEAQDMHLALVSLGLKDGSSHGGTGPKKFGDATIPAGDRVVITISWTGKDGKKVEMRAEDCVKNVRDDRTMEKVGWVFWGSMYVDEYDYDTGEVTGRKLYLASRNKTVIATYHDPTSILDNPLLDGGDHGVYYSNEAVLPEPGTPCVVTLKAPTAEERKEIEAIEADAAKRAEERARQREEEQKKQDGSK
jgi:hypothetical protein